MKCNIIRDLLPLYCDKLTSQDSNEEIEKHLHECEECNAVYESMNQKEDDIKVPEKDVKPLKKIKKRTLVRMIAAVFCTAATLTALYAFLFIGIIPISSEKLHYSAGEAFEIKAYEVRVGPNEDGQYFTEYRNESMDDFYPIPEGAEVRTEKHLRVDLAADNKYVNERSYMEFEDSFSEKGQYLDHKAVLHDNIRLYPVIRPLDSRDRPNECFKTYHVKEGDTLTIHCRDKDIEIDLYQLWLDNAKK